MSTALVECLNLRRPNGSNVQDVNSGSILIRASKSNQSTLILNVTGFAHSVSKTPAVVLYLMLYLMILHITLLNQTFNHCFCTLCITLAHSCTTFKIFGKWVEMVVRILAVIVTYRNQVPCGMFYNIVGLINC